jgi:integrase
MPPPKKTETRTEVLTEAELEAICTAHRGIQHTTRRHCLMWRFLFYQGLRPGEMYELRIRNVGLGAGEIQIGDPDWRQKSGQEDVIPLLPPGRFYARPFLSGAACVGRVPLAESGRSGVRRRLGCQPAILELQACRASGRGRRRDGYRSGAGRALSMYTLRHSCATHWLQEGKPLIWVNRLLRHSQVQTTMESCAPRRRGPAGHVTCRTCNRAGLSRLSDLISVLPARPGQDWTNAVQSRLTTK